MSYDKLNAKIGLKLHMDSSVQCKSNREAVSVKAGSKEAQSIKDWKTQMQTQFRDIECTIRKGRREIQWENDLLQFEC